MKLSISLLALSVLPLIAADTAQDLPFASKQIPEIVSLPDRTENFRKQIAESGGTLLVPPGIHRITGTLEFVLSSQHSALVRPEGGMATLVMDGAGPAIRIVGSHEGRADPKDFKPATFNERMPTIEGIEIVGNHPEADGIELARTFQPIISRVAVRWCRHGIHLIERNRNLVVSAVHLYENSGVGIYYDDVDFHQSNISHSHISYNGGGGIVVRDGNVRNIQINGCDIEANMPQDNTPTKAANILFDLSGAPEDPKKSVAEVAIIGCTLQHSSSHGGKKHKEIAPGGANLRILGKAIRPINSISVIGNLMSDTSLNVDLQHCTEIVLSGNSFFTSNPDNLHLTHCKRITVTGNTFNPRSIVRAGRIIIDQCSDSLFTNNTLRGLIAPDGALQVKDSARIIFADNILTESSGGIQTTGTHDIIMRDWIINELPATP